MLKIFSKQKKIKKVATIWLQSAQNSKENKNNNSMLYWKKRIRPSN